jgi:hypothetical protein
VNGEKRPSGNWGQVDCAIADRTTRVKDQMRVPDVGEIGEFFGAEPVEHSVEDGYWCYEIADKRGFFLRFSFSLYERSVQTLFFRKRPPTSP